MRRFGVLAMPFYAAGVVIGVCRVAIREAMREYHMQQWAKDAARLHLSDLAAEEVVRAQRASEKWNMN